MKDETVTLNIQTYNELRDFKKNIEEGNTLYEFKPAFLAKVGVAYKFMKTEKALEEIASQTEFSDSLNKDLKRDIKKLEESNKQKDELISDLKKMSYWKFRKWRKK